ncbi:MAG: phospholipase D-like domain-containing protein [Candidatus Altiarchaeota archaeon]
MASKITVFKTSPFDEEFRRIMYDLIDKAEEEILVVTGEAGAFRNYEDLKWAIRRAAGRGVKVRVCVRAPEQSTINKMISYGCEVYVGDTVPKDHYTVIDKKVVVTSLGHEPRKVGVRQGAAVFDRKKAEAKAEEFERHLKKAHKLKIDLSGDPLLRVLEKPLHLSFRTNSKNIELSP